MAAQFALLSDESARGGATGHGLLSFIRVPPQLSFETEAHQSTTKESMLQIKRRQTRY